MSNTCPDGHKSQTAEHAKVMAIIDADGEPQKVTRGYWVVWTCQINTLQHLIEMGLTSCYHLDADGCHPNLTDSDPQMTHVTLVDAVDEAYGKNPWVELLAMVDGNPFAISPQVVIDYVADAGILPTVPEEAE